MYLTRAFLNPRRQGAFRLLGNPQAMHAAVLGSFPSQPVPLADGSNARILWRLDRDNSFRPALWLVSPQRPDLTSLIEQAGWPAAEEQQWRSEPYEELLAKLSKGDRYAFRLTANPTRSVRVADGSSHTKRVEHVTAAHQARWLIAQSERCGFRLLQSSAISSGSDTPALDFRLIHREKLRFRRRASQPGDSPIPGKREKGGLVTLVQVAYEGGIEVTDPERLRHSLLAGIGRARAYGCGLLTLAPLQERQAATAPE